MICAWIETSSAEIGSSATMKSGSTARELMRVAFDEAFTQSHCFQKFLYALLRLPAPGKSEGVERLTDNLANSHSGIKRSVGILKYYLQMPPVLAHLLVR